MEATATLAAAQLNSIRISGFTSLVDFELDNVPPAGLLIGVNGTGKTNLLKAFEMLSCGMRSVGLEGFAARHGGADGLLHYGSETTPAIRGEIVLRTEHGFCEYSFTISHRPPDRLAFTEEALRLRGEDKAIEGSWSASHDEGSNTSAVIEAMRSHELGDRTAGAAHAVAEFLRNSVVHRFRDTSARSGFRTGWDADDNAMLRADGWNLVAVLRRIEREDPELYERICRGLSGVLPDFDRFDIACEGGTALLRWKAKSSGRIFDGQDTSDGNLCVFALLTFLALRPTMLPGIILIDEVELGLHDRAMQRMCEMVASLSGEKQVLLSTQSLQVMDRFCLDAFLLLSAKDGRTRLTRMSHDDYLPWLDRGYTTGDLWYKNVLGIYS